LVTIVSIFKDLDKCRVRIEGRNAIDEGGVRVYELDGLVPGQFYRGVSSLRPFHGDCNYLIKERKGFTSVVQISNSHCSSNK